MKVMFLCGYLPEGVGILFERQEESAGGWVKGFLNGIRNRNDLELYYSAFERSDENRIREAEDNGVRYFLVQYQDTELIRQFFSDHKCDVYHLFGMENDFVADLIPYLDFGKTLTYIQGIIDEYKYYYYAEYDRFHSVTPQFRAYMKANRKMFESRGVNEHDVISKAEYIAGRTDWDKAYVNSLDRSIRYFHLNESLRDEFYIADKWSSDSMTPHTIFVTQASYPIKAPHMIVEIVNLLKKKYPDVRCLIGGENLMKSQSAATRLGVSYASYIQRLINEYHLQNHIQFLGNLSGMEVIRQLQAANVFLLASSIENSPNSLQEAMLLGVPCISSFVGGVPTLVTSEEQCMLYPFNDPMQAAYKISRMFDDMELCRSMSEKAIERISVLTDCEKNGEALYQIYKTIYSESRK